MRKPLVYTCRKKLYKCGSSRVKHGAKFKINIAYVDFIMKMVNFELHDFNDCEKF